MSGSDLDRPLPIVNFKDQILQTVETYQVSFIQGDTGCGKSSMVPQFLLHQNPEARIIVTQPRRFAAISLSNRVGKQLGDMDLVGYRLGQGERRETPRSQVIFCTTGYFLQYLSYEPEKLDGWTHVILDEVHERTMDSDLLLLLMKLVLRSHPKVRVIIMSATLQPTLFINYFALYNATREPLTVGAQRFPVKDVFLDQLGQLPGVNTFDLPFYRECLDSDEFYHETARFTKPMQHLLVALLKKLVKPDTCYLVFLPGLAEIEDVTLELRFSPPHQCHTDILPLHSLLPSNEQDKVMQPIRPGTCKVVLSTNIAESSVTIPDAHFVIDCGLRRGIFKDERTGRPALLCKWVSRASARQRAGRTGRIAPGTVVHMYPAAFYRNALREYDEPEMRHASLEKTILTTRILFDRFGSVSKVLSHAITPPEGGRINEAIVELHDSAALEEPTETAQVTAIGHLAVLLPLSLSNVRLVLLGLTLGLLPEAIVMAACQEQPDLFVQPSRLFISDPRQFMDAVARVFKDKVYLDGGMMSEPMTNMGLYVQWLERKRCSISMRRAKMVDLMVAEVCRLLLGTSSVRLSPDARFRIEELRQLARGRGCAPGCTRKVFSRPDPNIVYFLLASATPNFLTSRQPEWDIVCEVAGQMGMDPQRSLLLTGLPPEICKPEQVLQSFSHPDCKASKASLLPGAERSDWIVELAPSRRMPAETNGIRDTSVNVKLLHQMYLLNRNQLLVTPKPGVEQEVDAEGLIFPNEIEWYLPSSDLNEEEELFRARFNMRSHLRLVCDLNSQLPDWKPLAAIASSISDLPNATDVQANGVTVLPPGLLGALLQLIMARKVRRLQMRPLEPNDEGKLEEMDREIVAAQVPGIRHGEVIVLSFQPYLLKESHLPLINKVRDLLTKAVWADLEDDQQLAAAFQEAVQCITSEPPASEELLSEASSWPWVSLVRRKTSEYLHPLRVQQQHSIMTEQQEDRLPKRAMRNHEREQDFAHYRGLTRRHFLENPRHNPTVTIAKFSRNKTQENWKLLGFSSQWELLDAMPDICTVEFHPVRKVIPVQPVPLSTIKCIEDSLLLKVQPKNWNYRQRQVYKAFRQAIAEGLEKYPYGLSVWEFSFLCGLLEVAETQLRFRIRFNTLLDLLRSMPDIIYLKGDPAPDDVAHANAVVFRGNYEVFAFPAKKFEDDERVKLATQRLAIFWEQAESVLSALETPYYDIQRKTEGERRREAGIQRRIYEIQTGALPPEDDQDQRPAVPTRRRTPTMLYCECPCHMRQGVPTVRGSLGLPMAAHMPTNVFRNVSTTAVTASCVVS